MKLSVVIPTIGRCSLVRSVESVLTISDLCEVIIVTHNQRQIFELVKDSRVKVIEIKEKDACSKRNAGLFIAKGDLILFLDDDDALTLTDEEYKLTSSILEDGHFTGAVFDTCVLQSEKQRIVRKGNGPIRLNDIILKNIIGTTSSVLLNRNLLLEQGILFDSRNLCRQDFDFWIRLLLKKSCSLYLTGIIGLKYDDTNIVDRLSKQKFNKKFQSLIKLYLRHITIKPILVFTIFNHIRYVTSSIISKYR